MVFEIVINGWNSKVRFEASHIVPGHPRCGRIHGHSYAVSIRIEGGSDDTGIVVDFSELKTHLRTIVETLDHRIIVPEKSPNLRIWESGRELTVEDGERRYVFPREDVVLLPLEHATAEQLSRYLLDRILESMTLPDSVTRVSVGVDEGPGQGAWHSRDLSAAE